MARVTGMRRLRNEERGAAAVEFAIISTVLFLLVFGIIQFGQAYSRLQVFEGAAREGARAAAVRGSTDDVIARVYDAAAPYVPAERPTVTGSCTADTVGDTVTVSWTQDFEISLPFLPAMHAEREIKGVFRCE